MRTEGEQAESSDLLVLGHESSTVHFGVSHQPDALRDFHLGLTPSSIQPTSFQLQLRKPRRQYRNECPHEEGRAYQMPKDLAEGCDHPNIQGAESECDDCSCAWTGCDWATPEMGEGERLRIGDVAEACWLDKNRNLGGSLISRTSRMRPMMPMMPMMPYITKTEDNIGLTAVLHANVMTTYEMQDEAGFFLG